MGVELSFSNVGYTFPPLGVPVEDNPYHISIPISCSRQGIVFHFFIQEFFGRDITSAFYVVDSYGDEREAGGIDNYLYSVKSMYYASCIVRSKHVHRSM